LRQKILATQDFFRKIRKEVPGIVIENCASGGHRLEPSMMALCDMASFSDAHECPEIPIIALNLHRAILPRQNQIWAVVKQSDTLRRLIYSLAATYLGRMCLSGEVLGLNEQQWRVVEEAMRFYQKIAPIIKHGVSYRYGPKIASYRFPEGWQALLRISADATQAMVVIHTFGGHLPEKVELPLREAVGLAIDASFLEPPRDIRIFDGKIICPLINNFEAVALYLRKTDS
jgi:alpha-galactosidase